MKNEFGVVLDRNGYAPSILQRGRRGICGGEDAPGHCYCCGRREGRGFLERLERHEPWGAANRQKSKALGLWVTLCRECHEETHRVLICRNGSRPRRAGTLDDSGKTSFSNPNRDSDLVRKKEGADIEPSAQAGGDKERASSDLGRELRADAQRAATLRYGWSREEWIERFGKSELSETEAAHIIPKDAGRGYMPVADGKRYRTVGQSAGGFRVIAETALPY